jgi:hypothetical protein
VETLWTFCHAKEILCRTVRDPRRLLHVGAASIILSLVPRPRGAQNARRLQHFTLLRTAVNVHRFEQTINGREYHIEVSAVNATTWRAQIAKLHGGSRALMPFYGRTPDEAAQQLSRGLALAPARTTPQVKWRAIAPLLSLSLDGSVF